MMERFCGLTDIEPVTHECSKCGKTISEEQSKYNLCDVCEMLALEKFVHYLRNEFTDYEREYLDACTEGISLTEPNKIKDVKAVY